ncbi:MAG: 3D domain-containing protein [Acidobacteria bacterium]|nr:3D domain-containing protein [Acidobacteriota bacterium]
MKSLLGGSAALAATVLAGYVLFNTQTLLAETISLQQTQTQQEKSETKTAENSAPGALVAEAKAATENEAAPEMKDAPAVPPQAYSATAYSFRGRTASGKTVGKGIIAADTRVLPLGTRVRLEAGNWSGEYTVADTGGAIRGRKIDVWVPTTGEACRFGRRQVKLTVLSYGARRAKAKARS